MIRDLLGFLLGACLSLLRRWILREYAMRLWARTIVQIVRAYWYWVPGDGSAVGNTALIRQLSWTQNRYWYARDSLLKAGVIVRARVGAAPRDPAKSFMRSGVA
jgi:hypothetical protein